MQDTRWVGSYPSAEKQSVYFTAPADWARFGWVLWHINHCKLFNAKSSLYKYIKYTYDWYTYFVDNILKQAWGLYVTS